MTGEMKKAKAWENWINLRRFLLETRINFVHLLAPAILAMIASFFEAASVGLLIPTVKGIIQSDFSFVRDLPVFRHVISLLPTIFKDRNSAIFILLIFSIFSAASLKNGFQYAASLGTVLQIRRFANNLRKRIYERYLSFNKVFFDQHNAGHLYQVLLGHTSQIATQMSRIQNAFYNVFSLIVYFALMIIISWKLTLFVLLAFPVLHFSLQWLIHKISKTSEFFSESNLKLGAKISNALSCIPLVKAYTHEQSEKAWFDQASDRIANIEISMDKKLLLINPIQDMILLCMMLLLVGMMAILFIRQGQGEVAEYMVFVVALRRTMGNLGVYNDVQSALASSRGPVKEVLKIFKQNNEYITVEGSSEFSGLQKGINFKDVYFSYREDAPVLKGVSFFIEKGKMTAIVGATGAGKTTLVNLLMRFYDVSAGEIYFDENNVKNFNLRSLRSALAWVSQEIFLFNASLRANLTYGLEENISEGRIDAALKKSRLYDFIFNLPSGLETEIGDRGVRLSVGEKQRIAIARAFLKEADILILDEATSSLDSKTEKMIQDALDDVVKDRTSIVIAHRLSTIKRADKIIVLEHGRIIDSGTFEDLVSKDGKFSSYWKQQFFLRNE